MCFNGQGARVDLSNLTLVLEIHVHVTFSVAHRELGLTSEGDDLLDLATFGVDHGRLGNIAVKSKYPSGRGIVNNCIWILTNLNPVLDLEGFQIEGDHVGGVFFRIRTAATSGDEPQVDIRG